jgi:taurine dioxygenase
MSDADGRALLDELKAHSTQAAYCHTYNYDIGDVIVWDNVQLLHAAPLTDFSDARTLWRITVKEAGPTL